MQDVAIAWVIAALICAIPTLMLDRNRRVYLAGLFASVAASVLIGMLVQVFPSLVDAQRYELFVTYLNPLIEELLRTAIIVVVLAGKTAVSENRYAGAAFGIAFGSFEICLKWMDLAMQWSADAQSAFAVVYSAVAPVSPFLMHVALSAIAVWMLRRKSNFLSIWMTLSAWHIANNASVFAFDQTLPPEYGLILVALRTSVFGIVSWLLVRR